MTSPRTPNDPGWMNIIGGHSVVLIDPLDFEDSVEHGGSTTGNYKLAGEGCRDSCTL